MNISDYLRTALLNHALGVAPYSEPNTIYTALYLVTPTSSGGGVEVSAPDYLRVSSAWNPAAVGVITNAAQIRFPVTGLCQNDWGTVVAIGLFDAAVNGNLLFFGPLSASVNLAINSDFLIASASLTISLS